MDEQLKYKQFDQRKLGADLFHSTSNVIFELIDEKKKVLDVGCATGRLAEKLRVEKDCYVMGIEFNEEEAILARTRCNDLIVTDIEKLQNLPCPEKYFDVIVFADVLEHLRDPVSSLNFFSRYLNDYGYVVASIPNAANWKLRLSLLFGKWNYKDFGLLDRTHLRFFTFRTMKQLFESCGYRIIRVVCTSGLSWLDWKMPLNGPANLWKSLFAYQFIIKAAKQA